MPVKNPEVGGGSGNGGNQGSEIPEGSYSFGGDLSEDLKIAETDSSGKKNFSTEENADGIHIKFAIPNKGVIRYEIFIEGIGQISETGINKDLTEDDFFYPFLTPGKEYTVRVKFLKDENQDDEGFTIPTPDQAVGYIDMKATAGANSKGEVRYKDTGVIEVKNNGDFTFTKKPEFENEKVLSGSGYDWVLEIGLSYGVSWEYPNRRSKWMTQIAIPNKDLLGKTYNFYTYERPYGDVTKVDFICWRPKMYYRYGDRQYTYQWDGKTVDTNCTPEAELWTDIDVSKAEDVAKIQGKWKQDKELRVTYSSSNQQDTLETKQVGYEILDIDSQNVTYKPNYTITKTDGSVFTKKEIANYWCYDTLSDTLPDEYFWYVEGEFYYSPNDNFAYKYKIYTLYSDVTVSADYKTIIDKHESEPSPLSEYFEDRKYYNGYTEHYDLKLFAGSKLRIIHSGKNEDGEDYEWYEDYKKQ